MKEFQPWLPFFTLLKREVLRFLSVSVQTIVTPIITASLYLLIFGVGLGSRIELFPTISYIQFVVPGLILMGVINNAFANSSSSIFFARYIGNIVDLLVTPLSSTQFIFAFTTAAMFRGVVVGSCVLLVSCFFTGMPWVNPAAALGMVLLTALLFAQFGIIAGVYSVTFDHITMFSQFLILPLIYTGGLFFPVSQLPPFWVKVSHFNPLTYMIDGFRQSILGVGDYPLLLDFAVAGGLALGCFAWAWGITRSGKGMRV